MSEPGSPAPTPEPRSPTNSSAGRSQTAGSNSRSGPRPPRPGDLIRLTGAASVQFAGDRAAAFRIISVDQRPTYADWVWLVGYTLNEHGQAVERREVFVQISGLVVVAPGRARLHTDG